MEHFARERNVQLKSDQSPVTAADLEAHHIIVDVLQRLTPEIPVISEEDTDVFALKASECYWLVDPLDGTRSFVRGTGEFTVNIGLIENAYPVMGAIYIPKQHVLFAGAKDIGAYRERIPGQKEIINARVPGAGLKVIKSSQHSSDKMEALLKHYPVAEVTSASSSIKFCVLAAGEADFYPRLGRTMEWDTAAGQAILEAAGGRVETLEGARFYYGKEGFENPSFLAFGK